MFQQVNVLISSLSVYSLKLTIKTEHPERMRSLNIKPYLILDQLNRKPERNKLHVVVTKYYNYKEVVLDYERAFNTVTFNLLSLVKINICHQYPGFKRQIHQGQSPCICQ